MLRTYQDYKQSTNYFVVWIQKVSQKSLSKKCTTIPNNTLAGLERRVEMIVSSQFDKHFFGSELWKETSKILRYGMKAIQLRKEVNGFHLSLAEVKDEEYQNANLQHENCIKVLERCYNMLFQWYEALLAEVGVGDKFTKPNGKEEPKKIPVATLLEVEEKEKENEEDDMVKGDLKPKANPASDMSIDEIDALFTEIRITLICLLLDLKAASDKVINVWEKYKREELSIYTTAIVTFAALKQVRSINSQLHLLFPQIESFDVFDSAIMEYLSPAERNYIKSLPFYHEFSDAGSLLINLFDGLNLHKYLKIPIYKRDHNLFPTETFFDERTASKPLLGKEKEEFFRQELRVLYNQYISRASYYHREHQNESEGYRNNHLMAAMMEQFDEFFRTGHISISLVFAFHIWYQIVLIMQDPDRLFLMKSNYLFHSYSYELSRRFTEDFDHPETERFHRKADSVLLPKYLRIIGQIQYERKNPFALRVSSGTTTNIMKLFPRNPYLSASCAVEDRFGDLYATTALISQSNCHYYRGICHIYHGLVNGGLLSPTDIPALDKFFHVFKSHAYLGVNRHNLPETIGNTSRKNEITGNDWDDSYLPKKGSYYKCYLLSSGIKLSDIVKIKKSGPGEYPVEFPVHTKRHGDKEEFSIHNPVDKCSPLMPFVLRYDFSRIYCDANGNEISDANHNNNSVSFNLMDFLEKVEIKTEEEIHSNPYFSMDLIYYFERIYEFFELLKKKFPNTIGICYKDIYDKQKNVHFASRFGESTIHTICTLILEAIEHPEDFAIPSELEEIVATMKEFFAIPVDPCENMYFLPPFSLLPGWSAATSPLSAGTTSIAPATRNQGLYEKEFGLDLHSEGKLVKGGEGGMNWKMKFYEVMEIFHKYEKHPVRSYQEKRRIQEIIKNHIKACPALLNHYLPSAYKSDADLSEDIKATVFDQALRHKSLGDVYFGEWVVAMGGLWSIDKYAKTSNEDKPKRTHLQTAAIAGDIAGLKLIFSHSYSWDYVNYQCPLDGNTAFHYACSSKQRSVELFLLFMAENCNPYIESFWFHRPLDFVLDDEEFLATFPKGLAEFLTSYENPHYPKQMYARDGVGGKGNFDPDVKYTYEDDEEDDEDEDEEDWADDDGAAEVGLKATMPRSLPPPSSSATSVIKPPISAAAPAAAETSNSKKSKTKKKAGTAAPAPSFSQEDVRKAEAAEKELLAMLEKEDEGKDQKKTGNKNNKSKGKKK